MQNSLKSLHLKNFTVFPDTKLEFGKNLNVIIGENGLGKSHILKAAYCAQAVSAQRNAKTPQEAPSKEFLVTALTDKLQAVFRPDNLTSLITRGREAKTCEISYEYADPKFDLKLSISPNAKNVSVSSLPAAWLEQAPVFLPTRELLTLLPEFIALYDHSYTRFEETWRDTCGLLSRFLRKGEEEVAIKKMLEPLEEALGGKVTTDKVGRFYIELESGSMEMQLVAEGLRKLAMVARLIATGNLNSGGLLLWDEPEANLNPRLIKTVAQTILQLSAIGVQVFVATHSLFLMRELDMSLRGEFKNLECRWFGLESGSGIVNVTQGVAVDDIGRIVSLDEDLMQSDRYRYFHPKICI